MRLTDFQGIPNSNAAHQGPLTVGNAAAALTSLLTLHAQTQYVLLNVETAAIRLTLNGTAPTSTLGFNYATATEILLSRAEALTCQVIRATAADGALQAAQFIN